MESGLKIGASVQRNCLVQTACYSLLRRRHNRRRINWLKRCQILYTCRKSLNLIFLNSQTFCCAVCRKFWKPWKSCLLVFVVTINIFLCWRNISDVTDKNIEPSINDKSMNNPINDISPNSIYQQQELHVLVTVSLFMDLKITYKYLSPISNDINFVCVVYVFIL